MKIAILGAGAFGTALGGVLTDKGYDINYYDSRLYKEKLSDVVKGAKYVVLCVPSSAAPYVLPYLPKNIPIIIATKGILGDQIFSKFEDYMVLSGPGFANDIKLRRPVKLTATDDRIIGLFSTDYLSFDTTEDRRGVLMCGALKNVYAILAGWLDLKPLSNAHEKYLEEVEGEMRELLSANGASAMTVGLECGKGDLRLTCALPSRNYEYGQKLKKDPSYKPDNTVEGLSTLKRIVRNEIVVPSGLKYLKQILEIYKDGTKR